MTNADTRYLLLDRGMWYFRERGLRKIRIRERYDSPEFWARYAELRKKAERGELKAPPRDAPIPGTWRGPCVRFFASETGLLAHDEGTERVRRLVLEQTFMEPIAPDDPQRLFGDCPLRHFTDESVGVLRGRKKGFPEAANVRLKAIGRVFRWALEEVNAHERRRYGITGNPVREVARLKPKRQGGHHTWTIEEIEQYEKRHPVGTKAHLGMVIMQYCGGRRADAVALGKQHTRNGRLRYTQHKGRKRGPWWLILRCRPSCSA